MIFVLFYRWLFLFFCLSVLFIILFCRNHFIFVRFCRLTFLLFCFRIYQSLSVVWLKPFDCASERFEYILFQEKYDEFFVLFTLRTFEAFLTVGCFRLFPASICFLPLSFCQKRMATFVGHPVLAYFFEKYDFFI